MGTESPGAAVLMPQVSRPGGSEPFWVLLADSWCDPDFSTFPLCALFSHHPTKLQHPWAPISACWQFTRLLQMAAAHSGLTHSPDCPLTLSTLPPTPQPWLFLSHMCLVLRIQFRGQKHNYGGGEIQVGKYTLQIFPLLNKFTLLGSFPCDSAGKESTCNAGDLGLIPGLGRSPGEGKGYSLQCSGLENSMGSQRVGHGLATFTFTFVRPDTTEQT